MKKNLFKFSLVLIFILFFAMAGQAKADEAVTVHLQIKTNDASLYDQNIAVNACPEADGSATSTVNARCAVDQTGLTDPGDWVYGGTFLNSFKGAYASDYVNNIYWGWFSNLEYGQVAMTQHLLINGEKLLLVYNTNPLKISVDNAAPYVNATSTITLEQFGLDSSWNPVWSPAASSTLVINGQEAENASGVYEYISTTTSPVLIYAKKAGFVDSDNLTVTAQAAPTEQTNPPAGGSIIIPSSGGGSLVTAAVKIDLGKAIDFLIAKQATDGSFGSALHTDWAAIALASANPNGAAGQKTKGYLLTDPNPLAGMNQVSDYARRAMALMSLNINPYNGVKTNYIKKITGLYDGAQFGDASLYNDDIFALLVLNKAGFSANDEMTKQAVKFVISKQQTDGSWASLDLTAAAIQALLPLSSLDGVSAAIVKARNFLFNAQGADGGFGNIYTTAWVMQAISALGENSGNWQKNGQTPEDFLVLNQGVDGGLDKNSSIEANRIWATSYAIPAVQGKPWSNILNSFNKEEAAADKKTTLGNSSAADNLIATSTSPWQATSTSLELFDLATSSSIKLEPEVLGIKIASSSAPLADRITEEALSLIDTPAPDFVTVGTESTVRLGTGERAGALNSYKSTFGKLPESQADWEDVIRISNNELPLENNPAAEERAKNEFKKVYDRDADLKNVNDQSAINFMAYGLRPERRDLDSERAGLSVFTDIYKYLPMSALDWDIIRAMAYSGVNI